MSPNPFESQWIFGLHDPGGEQIMLDAKRPGWLVFTEGIGHDPRNGAGKDFRPYSSRGLGIICRLNNGYYPEGTIPHSSQYANFAQRCANYVAASPGCHIWIIGNETNHSIERPAVSSRLVAATPARLTNSWWAKLLAWLQQWKGRRARQAGANPDEPESILVTLPNIVPPTDDPTLHGRLQRFNTLYGNEEAQAQTNAQASNVALQAELITPALYARCYRLCRNAIKRLPGHEQDLVLVAAPAPWNNETQYAGNERGDWVQYFTEILDLLGPQGCDGITLHTYTHGADLGSITSEGRMNAPFQDRRFEFRTYRDFLQAVPLSMRDLPVYITETDQVEPWRDANTGWVRQVYAEIDEWNRLPGTQKVRALVLYRWPKFDRWYLEGKNGVLADFRAALAQDYRWDRSQPQAARFNVGDRLQLKAYVNLRRTPGYLNKAADDRVAELQPGQQVVVSEDGSSETDGLVWWRVQVIGMEPTVRGWLAQFGPDGAALVERVATTQPPPVQPPPQPVPGQPAPRFKRGDQVRSTTIVNARRTAGYINKPPADIAQQIAAGTLVRINTGPQTVDGLIWWAVNAIGGGILGWVAETSPTGAALFETANATTPPAQPPAQPPPTQPPAPPPAVTPRFQKGNRVRTTTIVNVRRTAGYVGKQSGDVLRELPQGTILRLADGPQTLDGLVWWLAHDDNNARLGWLAESAPTGSVLLERVAGSGTPAGRFRIGERAMTVAFVRLRRSPGFLNKPADDVIADIWQGTSVLIVEGPQQVDDLTWWQVETQNITGQTVRGWMAESAPGGVPLLGEWSAEDRTPFKVGDLSVVGREAVRVRRTPGYNGKADDDVLGDFAARTTLHLLEGPRTADQLIWWRVSGISRGNKTIGWVAQGATNGAMLVGRAPKLPGTDIPNLQTGVYLATPYAGKFGITQLWGENPSFYARYSYEGVALQGHNGIDFATPRGTPVVATEQGQVILVGFEPGGFGNYIQLSHPWGESIYAHLDTVNVQMGQAVNRGAVVGLSGSTGNSSGPHLHFAIRIAPYVRTDGWGGYSDPLPYLNPGDVFWPAYLLDVQPQAVAGGPAPVSERRPPPGMAEDAPGLIRP